MVRFKHSDWCDHATVVSIPRWFDSSRSPDSQEGQLPGFNSTMVRFKLLRERGDRCRDGKFQFHDGSIQASKAPPLLMSGISFNSTMVRFKQGLI